MAARDTSPEARLVQLAALRRLGGAACVELAFAMSEEARRLSAAGLRQREPQLSEDEARARVLRRSLGKALYEAVYERRRP